MSRLVRTMAVATIAATALIAGVLASPAGAFHIPGATYSGPVTPGPGVQEGSIRFTVSGDGSSITSFSLVRPLGLGGCMLLNYEDFSPAPITNHAFSDSSTTAGVYAFDVEVSGRFPGVQRAEGSLIFTRRGGTQPVCHVTATWSATTSTSPAGSEECKAAQAQVNKAKKALGKAKKTGNEAKIKKLQKKLKKAKNFRNQVCGYALAEAQTPKRTVRRSDPHE